MTPRLHFCMSGIIRSRRKKTFRASRENPVMCVQDRKGERWMKEYGKLCGYFAAWVWKPFYRIVIALCVLELLLSGSAAYECASFSLMLDEMHTLRIVCGAELLFLFFVRRQFHQFFGAYRGIYTMAALPAPGWAFPAAAYTVTAAGVLTLAAVQLLMGLALYGIFFLWQGAGEGLYLAILRAPLFRYLLPHTPLLLAQTVFYLWVASTFPFFLMPNFRVLFRWRKRDWNTATTAEAIQTLLAFVFLFAMSFLRSNILIWYLLFDIGLPIALAFDLWSATVRPKPVE